MSDPSDDLPDGSMLLGEIRLRLFIDPDGDQVMSLTYPSWQQIPFFMQMGMAAELQRAVASRYSDYAGDEDES